MPGQNPDDLLAVVERFVSTAESEEAKFVRLNTWLARFTLDLAKRAMKKGRGRKPISRWVKNTENLIIEKARWRKAELVAAGMPREDAADQAAKEASDNLGKRRRNLAASTIKRRMQQRR
jgi:hypothetical protein